METNYSTPAIGVSQNKTQLFLIVGLVVALLIGFIAVFQAVRLQNRAAEVVTPEGGSCKVDSATCTHDLADLDPVKDKDLLDDIKASGKLIVRALNDPKIISESSYDPTTNSFVSRFTPTKGVQYVCTLEKPAGGKFELCANGQPGSVSCGPTPIISTPSPTPTSTITPTPQDCVDCVDGKFLCAETLTDKKVPGQNDANGVSCPSLSYWNINYETPKNTCPLLTPPPVLNGLDCDKHVVKVVPFGGGNSRTLSPKECLELKKTGPQGFVLRLHSGNKAGCINYDIKAYDENGDEMTRICENCTMLSGCPVSCAEYTKGTGEQLPNSEAIDLPPITNTDLNVSNECIPPFQNPDTNKVTACDFKLQGNACRPFNDPNDIDFDVNVEGYTSAGMYFDDQYGTPPNEVNNIPQTGRQTISHKYINSGHFNVVLYCDGGGQRHVCVKRVSLMCGGGGTPPVSTPTPPSCPALTVVLDLQCPGGNCPTKTP